MADNDHEREAFEKYFAASRKSKGATRQVSFDRLSDGTYADSHTQRHWWTWQQALQSRQQDKQNSNEDRDVYGVHARKGAVVNKDGTLSNFLLNVGGKPFRCQCGCNVFHKPKRKDPNLYQCNACELQFESY